MTVHGGDNSNLTVPRFTALHSLPSANAENPIIVNTPRPRRLLFHCARLFGTLTVAVLVLIATAVVLLESGVGDAPLADRAERILQNMAGDRFVARVDGAALRLAQGGSIAIEAKGVHLEDIASKSEAVSALSMQIALQARPLLSGEFRVSHIVLDGGYVDLEHLGLAGSQAEGSLTFRIENIGEMVDRALAGLATAAHVMEERGTRRILLKDAVITGVGRSPSIDGGRSLEREIDIVSAEITESPENGLQFEANVKFAEQDIRVDARTLPAKDAQTRQELVGHVNGLRIGDMIREFTGNPRRKFRLESSAEIEFSAKQSTADAAAALEADLRLSAGELFMDGVASELKGSFITLALDPKRKTLDFKPSELNIGESTYNFNGAIIDLENLSGQTEAGFGLDLLVDNATVAPRDSSEPPVTVAMKALARFVKRENRLYIDDFIVSGAKGAMFSSASIQLSETSPEVSFVANIETMDTATVKQLWPYWIAKQARQWVHNNLFGGTVSDGSIRVFIPEGRMAKALPNSLNLDRNQLQIAFNVTNARFDVAGDIPPVREADGLLSLRGQRLELQISKGRSFFPTERNVEISDGTFVIPDTNAHPLMAQLDIGVAGDAAAVAELVSYKPINALERTPYTPDDFEGPVASKVDVTFGLIQQQNPPSPDWKVELDLGSVNVGPRIDGVKVTDAKGKMFVDPEKIVFDTDASLDGITGHLDFTEPLNSSRGTESDRVVHLIMDNKDRAQLAPQLNTFIDGTVDVSARLHGDSRREISSDLTRARLMLPWIGWSKGKGIKASATFVMTAKSDGAPKDDSETPRLQENISIDDLVLKGDGFSARGKMRFDKGELVSADFSQVTLNRNDSFAVKVVRKGSTYKIDVSGKDIDLRSSIKEFLSETGGGGGGALDDQVDLTIRTGRALGFGGESLGDFRMDYSERGGTILALDLKGTAANGLSVEARGTHDGSGMALTVTSSDAGGTARFLDIYDKAEGGRLDAKLFRAGNGPYVGTVDIPDFDIVGEERLQSLVSSRPEGGKSLNQAVRREIGVGRVHFDHAFARVDKGPGYLRLSDGIARGPLVGFAFQGTVYDDRHGMNIAGTFMPAYGLNRVFGEIPILGAILGNGRDRGLIGITFRLSGSFEDPRLEANPISIIAPGIFRNIFQFSSGFSAGERYPKRRRSGTVENNR